MSMVLHCQLHHHIVLHYVTLLIRVALLPVLIRVTLLHC